MYNVPAIGRLDLTLASLLVVECHRVLRDGAPSAQEVAADVLAVADHLDVPAECLCDLETFERSIDESLRRLVAAGWLARDDEGDGPPGFYACEMAEMALAWIRGRLGRDHDLIQAYEALELDVDRRILSEYGDDVPDDAELTADVRAD